VKEVERIANSEGTVSERRALGRDVSERVTVGRNVLNWSCIGSS